MIRRNITRIVSVMLAAGVCYLLMQQMNRWVVVAAWAAALGVCCCLAALLVKSSTVGQVSWKNIVAGIFLRWGYSVSRGKLPVIALVSWAVWTLIAVGVALQQSPATVPSTPSTGIQSPNVAVWKTLLLIGWTIDVAALLCVLGVVVKNSSAGSSAARSLITIIAILMVMLIVSVVLNYTGATRSAAIVAGGPPLLVAIAYGAFIAVVLTAGRNARWN